MDWHGEDVWWKRAESTGNTGDGQAEPFIMLSFPPQAAGCLRLFPVLFLPQAAGCLRLFPGRFLSPEMKWKYPIQESFVIISALETAEPDSASRMETE